VLHDEGLPAALRALGETSHLSVSGAMDTRLPLAVETTGYLLVARIAGGTADRITVDLAFSDVGLVIETGLPYRNRAHALHRSHHAEDSPLNRVRRPLP
jgi:hypothetical protein